MSELTGLSQGTGLNSRRYTLLGALFGLLFPVVATAVYLASEGLPLTGPNVLLAQSQPLMWIIDTAPVFLGALASLAGRRQDAVEASRNLLTAQAVELRASHQQLEMRVADRTRELEQHALDTRRAVDITRRLSDIHDVPDLAANAVQLIGETVPGYLVDLYLIDDRRAEASLAASSEGGAARGTSVLVGAPGVVGHVAATGEMASATSEVRGTEIAFPLVAGGKPLGVLHLRPESVEAGLPRALELLRLLADQVAASIESARLYGEAREALRQLQALTGRTAQTGWPGPSAGATLAFEFTPSGTRPAQPGAVMTDAQGLRIPLELRGQRIGSIVLARGSTETWTEADRDLAQKTAAQVALALENIRLLEDTRERALQEQRLGEFSARLGQSVDLDSMLQIAVRELAALPEVAEASIYLNPTPIETPKGPA